MKIAVYSIAKNEAKHVERWAQSASKADVLVILDTGSEDETVSIARSLGITTVVKQYEQFEFHKARNDAMDAIPDDVDYCISMDMDEVLLPGWREELEKTVREHPLATQFTYTFINSRLPSGEPLQTWDRSCIHVRHGARWRWPIHEILETNPQILARTNLLMEHKPDRSKPRTQYIQMLKQATLDMPEDSRMSFYYGRELWYERRLDEAATELIRSLTLNGWAYERSSSMCIIANCIPPEAEIWLLRACAETPDRREPFVDLADLYYQDGRYACGLGMAVRAISMANKNPSYVSEDGAWNHRPYDIAALCAYNIGAKELSLEYGIKALELSPDDKRLQDNLNWYKGKEPVL